MLHGNFNAQNSSVASFSFYKMHSFHKTCNLFPLNLHSFPFHGCLPSPRSSTNLVPDVLAQGGGCLSFLVWKELTWLWSQSHSSPEASQLSGHQLCDPAISSVCLLYFVFLFFSCRNTPTSRDVAREGSPSLPAEWSVLMLCVRRIDSNVWPIMMSVVWWGIIYSLDAVIWWHKCVCVLHVLIHLLKPPLSW